MLSFGNQLAGIQDALRSVERSAYNIAYSTGPGRTSSGRGTAGACGASDLCRETVGLMSGKKAVEINCAVIKTLDEVVGSLLDILA